jgi:putative endopeptidase
MAKFRIYASFSPAVILLTLAVIGCSTAHDPVTDPTPRSKTPVESATIATVRPDVVAANVDTSVNPGADFFTFANGAWLRSHPIPASEATWGIDKEVRDELFEELRDISESAAQGAAAQGSDLQKIGDFWSTAMDQAKADQLGMAPIQPELARIDDINSMGSAIDETFALQPLGVNAMFSVDISQDEKQSDVIAVHLWQGGLGLPNRDYYFNPEDGIAKARAEYVQHLTRLFERLGTNKPDATRRALGVMTFETRLAGYSRKLAELRDPLHNYNRMSPAQARHQLTPAINWDARLSAWNIDTSYVIVGQPEFFTGLQGLLGKTKVGVLRDYLRAHLIDRYASYLDQDLDQEHFGFYAGVLTGQKEQLPRWKRSLQSENKALGMVLGRIFVQDYFPQSSKERYDNLVEAIRTAYGERIEHLDWMSDATKVKAREKLAAVTKKVGYPDHWKDYSLLTIARTSYCDNMMRAARWHFNDMLSKFGKPVDRSEWEMTPQTYNAYYNPSNNEIVLPAAQFAIPRFKDADVDDAVVYGYAAASTIGHEMTHGFDDEGRKFDAAGNLSDWWTQSDAEEFQQRADLMVKQFDAYEPIPGIHINGRASLGENIADYGGLLIGIDAFKNTEQFKKGQAIAGFSPMQRFFLGYALGWLFEEREAMLRQGLLSDVHAPPKWRVNGPLSNIPEFYEAFDVKPGQAMWRPDSDRVRIW